MFKILYSAGNYANSKIQLQRFLQAVSNKPYTVKVAAYKRSSPKNQAINWTMDCFLDMFNHASLSLNNDNLQIYFQQVKSFRPNLIISDMDYYTSHIANTLNIPLWQCSSSFIDRATIVNEKVKLGLRTRYSYVLDKTGYQTAPQVNTVEVSDHNLVYSHLGDTNDPPTLKPNFQWVRPYHPTGKSYIPCQHNIISATLAGNKKILSLLKRYPDCVAFTENYHERYDNIQVKDIANQQEYACNLKNCNAFVCQGQTSFLADAYYNGKRPLIMPDFNDGECVINSMYSEHQGLGTCIYDPADDITDLIGQTIEPLYSVRIKQLHEMIEEIV